MINTWKKILTQPLGEAIRDQPPANLSVHSRLQVEIKAQGDWMTGGTYLKFRIHHCTVSVKVNVVTLVYTKQHVPMPPFENELVSYWNNGLWNQPLTTYPVLLYKQQWNTKWAFARKLDIFTCENNMVKITCHLHMWKYHRCYGFIINRTFQTKKLFK